MLNFCWVPPWSTLSKELSLSSHLYHECCMYKRNITIFDFHEKGKWEKYYIAKSYISEKFFWSTWPIVLVPQILLLHLLEKKPLLDGFLVFVEFLIIFHHLEKLHSTYFDVLWICRIIIMQLIPQPYQRELKLHTSIWMMEVVLDFLSQLWKQWAYSTIQSHPLDHTMRTLVWCWHLLKPLLYNVYIWLYCLFWFFSFLSVHTDDGWKQK